MLTKEEALIAAQRAMVWPVGHGREWILAGLPVDKYGHYLVDVTRSLKRHPDLKEHG